MSGSQAGLRILKQVLWTCEKLDFQPVFCGHIGVGPKICEDQQPWQFGDPKEQVNLELAEKTAFTQLPGDLTELVATEFVRRWVFHVEECQHGLYRQLNGFLSSLNA